jgi:hypothetical protein
MCALWQSLPYRFPQPPSHTERRAQSQYQRCLHTGQLSLSIHTSIRRSARAQTRQLGHTHSEELVQHQQICLKAVHRRCVIPLPRQTRAVSIIQAQPLLAPPAPDSSRAAFARMRGTTARTGIIRSTSVAISQNPASSLSPWHSSNTMWRRTTPRVRPTVMLRMVVSADGNHLAGAK